MQAADYEHLAAGDTSTVLAPTCICDLCRAHALQGNKSLLCIFLKCCSCSAILLHRHRLASGIWRRTAICCRASSGRRRVAAVYLASSIYHGSRADRPMSCGERSRCCHRFVVLLLRRLGMAAVPCIGSSSRDALLRVLLVVQGGRQRCSQQLLLCIVHAGLLCGAGGRVLASCLNRETRVSSASLSL